jgi:hypothetical protein
MDQSQMAKVLEELGATLDEVAERLQVSGVQGVRNAVRFLNPIVRYVHERVRVDARSLDLIQGDQLRLTLGNGRKIEVVIPEPVRRFLDAFDRGRFPELELSTVDA